MDLFRIKQKKKKNDSGSVTAGKAAVVLLMCVFVAAGALAWTVHSRHEEEAAKAAEAKRASEELQTESIDPMLYVGAPTIASAGGEGIHDSEWSPRENAPWICVIRAKDPEKRLKIAEAMTQALELHQVKYSGDKEKRQTFYQEAAKVDFDLTKVTAECYTSCTSVASVALRAAGYPEEVAPQLVYSDSLSEKTNLRKHLAARTDLFDAFTTEDYTASADKLEAGDILFSEHHVATVIKSENPVDNWKTRR